MKSQTRLIPFKDGNNVMYKKLSQLEDALNVIKTNILEAKYISIKEKGLTRMITASDIIMIKSDSNYSKIYLNNGIEILTSKTLKHWSSILEGNTFLRVHASYLINRNHIVEIKNNKRNILMNNNLNATISRQPDRKNLLKEINLNQFKHTTMKYLVITFLILIPQFGFSQSVGIGTTNPDESSILEVKSTTDGLLIPRMTTAQRNDIISPADGLLVYDKDKQTIYYFDGEIWTPFIFAVDPNYSPSKKIYYQVPNGGDDGFGESADLKDNYAIVGAPTWEPIVNAQSDDYGKAFIYNRFNGSWSLQAEIQANVTGIGDKFGTAVAIDGEWAVIGTPYQDVGANTNEGSVFVFRRNGSTWSQFAELTGSNATSNDNFGYSVSIDNEIIAIGAPGDDINIGGNNIIDQGSVYVFEFTGTNWVQRAKLYDADPALESKLGFSVDVDVSSGGGYYLIAGAPYRDVGANLQQGSAYAWGSFNDPVNWILLSELTSSNGNDNDNFGFSVSVQNQNFGVGAPFYGTNDIGSSYYFKWDGSSYVQHNVNIGLNADGNCGRSVSCSDNKIMVGSPGNSTNGLTESGSAGIYYANGSNGFFKNILDANPQSNAKHGYIVCMSNYNILVVNTFGYLQFMNIE